MATSTHIREAVAHIRYIHIAPQKMRRIADLVRSMDVAAAEHLLSSVPKRATLPVWKAIKSAAANAVHNYELDPKRLYVRTITVGDSLELPRMMPRAQGRAYRIRKRFSHVYVTVAERPAPKTKRGSNHGKTPASVGLRRAVTSAAPTLPASPKGKGKQ